MGQQETRHPEYERGYHDGYQSGVHYALTSAIDVAMKSSQPSMVVTAPAEVVVAAKRELAEKVLAAIDNTRPTLARGSASLMKKWTREAVERVFAESGVAVEAKGGDAK